MVPVGGKKAGGSLSVAHKSVAMEAGPDPKLAAAESVCRGSSKLTGTAQLEGRDLYKPKKTTTFTLDFDLSGYKKPFFLFFFLG